MQQIEARCDTSIHARRQCDGGVHRAEFLSAIRNHAILRAREVVAGQSDRHRWWQWTHEMASRRTATARMFAVREWVAAASARAHAHGHSTCVALELSSDPLRGGGLSVAVEEGGRRRALIQGRERSGELRGCRLRCRRRLLLHLLRLLCLLLRSLLLDSLCLGCDSLCRARRLASLPCLLILVLELIGAVATKLQTSRTATKHGVRARGRWGRGGGGMHRCVCVAARG